MSFRNFQGKNSGRARAFTLLEIMIVIVIIGLLAGVATINVRSYLMRAKQSVAKQDIATISKALEDFNATYDRYPTNEEGIEILAQPTEKLSEPLLTKLPIDPWSNPYQYNAPGRKGPYEVICFGADGREGGEDVDADISSDDLQGSEN